MNEVVKSFEKTIQRLREALAKPKDDTVRDSCIKRFELCFDLAWKSIKYYAKQQGRECNSPRACFKLAFELKLIDDEEQWLQTINDRNEAAHIYREQIAEGVYSRLGNYVTLFELLLSKMRE